MYRPRSQSKANSLGLELLGRIEDFRTAAIGGQGRPSSPQQEGPGWRRRIRGEAGVAWMRLQGPGTEAGKRIARMNPLKHDLRSEVVPRSQEGPTAVMPACRERGV